MISIVMTSFNRPKQLRETLRSIEAQKVDEVGEIIVVDEGDPSTELLCKASGVKYFKMNRPPSAEYSNPVLPLNIGIRQSSGEVIILQNAECKHVDPDTIRKLTSLVTPTNAVFARVIALDEEGRELLLYCGRENPRPYFFCGAIRREWFERLRGFDEDYKAYGYEDDDFADRLRREGVEFIFTDVLVYHQWHPYPGKINDVVSSRILYEAKRNEPTVRNLGREWGQQL
jgi:GT2 family glycosyltransferase